MWHVFDNEAQRSSGEWKITDWIIGRVGHNVYRIMDKHSLLSKHKLAFIWGPLRVIEACQ